jgi:hypothetical protein
MDYIDDFRSCERTYATFRIYPQDQKSSDVTRLIGMEPTNTSRAGARGLLKGRRYVEGWFLCSKDIVDSKDCRRHIDWLLDRIEGAKPQILELKRNGARMDILCFWTSAAGNGGPVISPKQMKRLLEFGLEVEWDFWCCEQT